MNITCLAYRDARLGSRAGSRSMDTPVSFSRSRSRLPVSFSAQRLRSASRSAFRVYTSTSTVRGWDYP